MQTIVIDCCFIVVVTVVLWSDLRVVWWGDIACVLDTSGVTSKTTRYEKIYVLVIPTAVTRSNVTNVKKKKYRENILKEKKPRVIRNINILRGSEEYFRLISARNSLFFFYHYCRFPLVCFFFLIFKTLYFNGIEMRIIKNYFYYMWLRADNILDDLYIYI